MTDASCTIDARGCTKDGFHIHRQYAQGFGLKLRATYRAVSFVW
jgi:hypothetical protein